MAPATDHLREGSEPSTDTFQLETPELNKQPEEVFDIVCKLGEGSYGAVHMAIHKSSGHTLAIKKVPVDTDLQEIIKEISIMQQCDSKYVVKYYGSYFKNSDLWIVMEYCGAGSVSDIMRLRRKTLNELEISSVLRDTLKGLRYLHGLKKIHRDIKAGNILLTLEGHAKLADFGVAGQLTDTMAKRNTVIGTPFWMAPEVIEEIGYDTKADMWSLGITSIEAAEGRPPYAEIHPMRAIFMIPTKPPPTLKNPEDWSHEFNDFVLRCLVKKPEDRATAAELLEHPFIVNAQGPHILEEMIRDAKEIAEANNMAAAQMGLEEVDSGTMLRNDDGTMMSWSAGEEGTLIQHPTYNYYQTAQSLRNQMQQLMIGGKIPAVARGGPSNNGNANSPMSHLPPEHAQALGALHQNSEQFANMADRSLSAIGAPNDTFPSTLSSQTVGSADFQHALTSENFEFLRGLTMEELIRRKNTLEDEMDNELKELQRRYQNKRQPILDAINDKKNQMTL
ncbi:unnamed protein product, partial [Mesorhabditis belari]|uniref:Serine/threonine-protein kinase cst-1 n=1 Tax=Mesorhabditis belari TaxID=2138241 RepID=A0AAF3FKN8_9BILA